MCANGARCASDFSASAIRFRLGVRTVGRSNHQRELRRVAFCFADTVAYTSEQTAVRRLLQE